MRHGLAALVVILGLAGAAHAQEGREEKKKGAKEPSIGLRDLDANGDGRASVSELQTAINRLKGEAPREKGKEERKEREGSVPLKDVDANNDGRATLPELEAALEKAKQGGEKRDGDKKEEGGKKKRD